MTVLWDVGALTFGAVGGALIRIIKEKESFNEALITIALSILVVFFIGIPIVEVFGNKYQEYQPWKVGLVVGYIVGLCAVTISGFLVDFQKEPLKVLQSAKKIVVAVSEIVAIWRGMK